MIKIKLKISALRANLGLTQNEMADRLGISRSTYIDFEREPYKYPIKYCIELCEMTNCKLDDIDYGLSRD